MIFVNYKVDVNRRDNVGKCLFYKVIKRGQKFFLVVKMINNYNEEVFYIVIIFLFFIFIIIM